MYLKMDVDNLSLMCERVIKKETRSGIIGRVKEIQDTAEKAKSFGVIYTMLSEEDFNLIFKRDYG